LRFDNKTPLNKFGGVFIFDETENMTPKKLFNFFAIAEAFTWTALIVAIILRATGAVDPGVSTIVGGLHGAVFLGYGVSAALVGVNQRWAVLAIIGGIFLAIVPYATIPFERNRNRDGRLDGGWRTSATSDARDASWFDRLFRWFISRPMLLIVTMAAIVVGIFSLLLWLGPPDQWGK
jgi:integral membrane protein